MVTAPTHNRRSPSRKFLSAIALATGMALAATAVATPAEAQRTRDRDRDRSQQQQPQELSNEFIEAYRAIEPNLQEGGNLAAAEPQLAGLLALANSPDEKQAAGSIVYNYGTRAQDQARQFQGVTLMLESGKVPPEALGQYNFIAGQLAFQAQDYPTARRYVLAAMDAGYRDNNPEILVAETYFAADQFSEGLEYLSRAVDAREAAGETPPEDWLRRGLAVAYRGNLGQEAQDFGYRYARAYPSDESWGDAIIVVRNFGQFADDEILDLARLQRRTGTMRDERMYLEYIEAADPRRLPGEVRDVIDEGYASGVLSRNQSYAADAYATATGRVETDRTDLPELGREADAAGADLRTLVAAGDTFLSYGEASRAEGYYRRALDMAGSDRGLLLNRIGIALVDQGRHAEAIETFGQVSGNRAGIARLWSAYAEQQMATAG
jgi:predicted Zn-dependent protease